MAKRVEAQPYYEAAPILSILGEGATAGHVITADGAGGAVFAAPASSGTLYTTDGTISADRTVSLANRAFTLGDSGTACKLEFTQNTGGQMTLRMVSFDGPTVAVTSGGTSGDLVTLSNGSASLTVDTAVISMTRNLNMTSNKIIGLAAPTSATDAATKAYVDAIGPTVYTANGSIPINTTRAITVPGSSQFRLTDGGSNFLLFNPSSFFVETGGVVTLRTAGNITLDGAAVDVSSSKIINLATPTLPTDATTKAYVDLRFGRRDVREVGGSATVTIADNVILVSTTAAGSTINIDLFDSSTYPADGTTRSYSVIRATHVPLSTTVRVRLTGGDTANGFGYRGYTEWYLNNPEDAVECFVYNSAVLGPMWSLPTRKRIFRQVLINNGSQALSTGATTSTIVLSFTSKVEDQRAIASSAAVPTTAIVTNVAGKGTFRLQGFLQASVTVANHSHVLNLRQNGATIRSIPLGAQFDGEILPYSISASDVAFSAADSFDLQLVSTATGGGTITAGTISNSVFSLFPDV